MPILQEFQGWKNWPGFTQLMLTLKQYVATLEDRAWDLSWLSPALALDIQVARRRSNTLSFKVLIRSFIDLGCCTKFPPLLTSKGRPFRKEGNGLSRMESTPSTKSTQLLAFLSGKSLESPTKQNLFHHYPSSQANRPASLASGARVLSSKQSPKRWRSTVQGTRQTRDANQFTGSRTMTCIKRWHVWRGKHLVVALVVLKRKICTESYWIVWILDVDLQQFRFVGQEKHVEEQGVLIKWSQITYKT